MDQINVQRWANSLRQFHRNHFQPPFVTDVYVGNQTGVRNASTTTTKIRQTESPNDNHKYSFTLDFTSHKKDSIHSLKSQFYTFDMTTKDEENLHSPSHNHTSNMLISSSDHHDIDTLSDAGTYIVEDDVDIAQDDKLELKKHSSSSFKRYADRKKNRHGTFEIQGLISSTAHTIHRPIVDSNIPTHDLPSSSSSSSSSSCLSIPNENDQSISEKSFSDLTYAPNTLSQQQTTTPPPPPQKHKKPAECFVISPPSETKYSLTTNNSQRKTETSLKSKLSTKSVSITDSNLDSPINQLNSPLLSPHSTEKYSFHLQNQSPSAKLPVRPHITINDQTNSSSTLQRNSTLRQTIPGNSQNQRQIISSATTNNDDSDETTPNLTKFYINKSFALRQQHSNPSPTTSKSTQQQTISKPVLKTLPRQSSKPTTITALVASIPLSSGQTNRAVELRRARAQAKIEELSQRTKKQLLKTNHQNDIMSASWHSSASSTNKKDLTNLRSNPPTTVKTNTTLQRQDTLSVRPTLSSSHQRSSSASPNTHGETSSKYRKAMISSVTDEQKERLSASAYSIEEERCDSLRDNGQRLAIKLIQLSSGILEKLKPNDAVIYDNLSAHELEQLINKLQIVNRTLISIDASLTIPTSDDTFG